MLPFHFIRRSLLFTSTIIVVSSSSFLSIWIALEINTLAFIPIIKGKAVAKYFLAQRVGSAIILAGLALNIYSISFVGATIKAGIAPLHFWFPQVMTSISWFSCALISTWQKIAPIRIIFSFQNFLFNYLLILLRLFIGTLGAIKQTQLRPLIGFSSVVSIGWILRANLENTFYSVMYISVYLPSTIFLLTELIKKNRKVRADKTISLPLILFSIAGLPPFIGLLPKITILTSCPPTFLIPLISASLLVTYIYSSIAISLIHKVSNVPSQTAIFGVICTPLFITFYSLSTKKYICLPSKRC